MEYVFYLAPVVALLVFCCFRLRILHRADAELAGRRSRRAAPVAARATPPDPAMQRALQRIPVPWGWPGSEPANHMPGAGGHGVSESLHRWVDHLVAEKKTNHDEVHRKRLEASMRALLEDRFGTPREMGEIEYRKTRPPLLRDPSAPHDQMDNFPSGRLDAIESRLKPEPGKPKKAGVKRRPAYEKLSNIRTPWGW